MQKRIIAGLLAGVIIGYICWLGVCVLSHENKIDDTVVEEVEKVGHLYVRCPEKAIKRHQEETLKHFEDLLRPTVPSEEDPSLPTEPQCPPQPQPEYAYSALIGSVWRTPEQIDALYGYTLGTTRIWQHDLYTQLSAKGMDWMYPYALAQAKQESNFNLFVVNAANKKDSGLFQMRRGATPDDFSWWNGRCAKYGIPVGTSIFDAHAQVTVYVGMISEAYATACKVLEIANPPEPHFHDQFHTMLLTWGVYQNNFRYTRIQQYVENWHLNMAIHYYNAYILPRLNELKIEQN